MISQHDLDAAYETAASKIHETLRAIIDTKSVLKPNQSFCVGCSIESRDNPENPILQLQIDLQEERPSGEPVSLASSVIFTTIREVVDFDATKLENTITKEMDRLTESGRRNE